MPIFSISSKENLPQKTYQSIPVYLLVFSLLIILTANIAAAQTSLDESRNLDQAMDHIAQGYQVEAIEELNKIIETNPSNPEAYYNRGIAYYNSGYLNKAERDYLKAVELNPFFFQAFYFLGLTYHSMGMLEEAITNYNKTLEINPQWARVYVKRGLAYLALGNHTKALENYNKAIDVNRRLLPAYLNRAALYEIISWPDRAADDYTNALKLSPFDDETYYKRAALYTKLNRSQEAIDDYTKLLDLKRDNPVYCSQFHYLRGLIYLNSLKQVDKALEDFKQAIVLRTQFSSAHYQIGLIYEKQNRLMEAVRHYSKALEIKPDNKDALLSRAELFMKFVDYEGAWQDIHELELLPDYIEPEFLPQLKKDSNREK